MTLGIAVKEKYSFWIFKLFLPFVEMSSLHLVFLWKFLFKILGEFISAFLPATFWARWKVCCWEMKQRPGGKAGSSAKTHWQEAVYASQGASRCHSALQYLRFKEDSGTVEVALSSRASWKVEMLCWQIWTFF